MWTSDGETMHHGQKGLENKSEVMILLLLLMMMMMMMTRKRQVARRPGSMRRTRKLRLHEQRLAASMIAGESSNELVGAKGKAGQYWD